jgi:hypothetical protein
MQEMQKRLNATNQRKKEWDGKPFRILACDPGGTTGYKYAEWMPIDGYKTIPFDLEDLYIKGGQIGPDEHHVTLDAMLEDFHAYDPNIDAPLEIVCESFEFRQHIKKDHAKTKVELISKEYIGIVKLFAANNWASCKLYFQTASAAKDLVDDWKIKVLGRNLWVPGNDHENDAARHLFRHMVVTKRIREPITNVWLDTNMD